MNALVPPKPNEFDSTQSERHVVAALPHDRHVGERRIEVSILALSQMKPLFIISSE